MKFLEGVLKALKRQAPQNSPQENTSPVSRDQARTPEPPQQTEMTREAPLEAAENTEPVNRVTPSTEPSSGRTNEQMPGGTPAEPVEQTRAAEAVDEKIATTAGSPSADQGGTQAITDPEKLREEVINVLRTVYDPEIPVNIYDLGLIYELTIDPPGVVNIKMTLTAPGCPAVGYLPNEVVMKVGQIPGVEDVRLELVWDPPWDMSRMSEEAKLQLGFPL